MPVTLRTRQTNNVQHEDHIKVADISGLLRGTLLNDLFELFPTLHAGKVMHCNKSASFVFKHIQTEP